MQQTSLCLLGFRGLGFALSLPPQQSQAGHHQSFCRTRHTKFLFFLFVRALCMSCFLAWIDFIREILLSQVSECCNSAVGDKISGPARVLRFCMELIF